MALTIESPAFAEGERIPKRYTCEGEDVSPALEWSDSPEDTRSFVLICSDPDAPAGTWHHWAVYDIVPDARELPEAYPTDRSGQAVNDFGRSGYGGPCPPKGHGRHRYVFRLLALDRDRLDLGQAPRCKQVEDAAKPHILAEAALIGLYSR